MIRRHYALPQEEFGCNAIRLQYIHQTGHTVEVQPGVAELDLTNAQTVTIAPGVDILVGARVVDGSFVARPEVKPPPCTFRNVEDWEAWLETEFQPDPADNVEQQLISAMLFYAWLQDRAGVRPLS